MGVKKVRSAVSQLMSKPSGKPGGVSFDNPREVIDPHVKTQAISTREATVGGYKLPSSDGTANQVLTTNGSGTVTWEDAGGGGSGRGLYGLMHPSNYSAIGAGTWAYTYNASSYLQGYLRNSSNANGDSMSWSIELAEGTYTFVWVVLIGADGGKIDVIVDGTTEDTIDLYNAGPVFNTIKKITGITVAADKTITVTLTANGKHASSGGYKCYNGGFWFMKTA
jgi:hypothetical protein